MWEQQTGIGIEYVHKHTSQLACACSEDAARDVVWAGSLARVNTFKCFTFRRVRMFWLWAVSVALYCPQSE